MLVYIRNKDVSSDFIPVNRLHFAGEFNNSLHFYTEHKNRGDEEIVWLLWLLLIILKKKKLSAFRCIPFSTRLVLETTMQLY